MKIMAVVKADAYGHGAVEISKHAIAAGVDYLSVAFLDEALELRHAGIEAPILVLGYTPPSALQLAWQYDITVTAYSKEVGEEILSLTRSASFLSYRSAQGSNRKLRVHIKVDTGMGRIGLHTQEEAIAFIDEMLLNDGVDVEGLFTHYANADEEDKSYTYEQFHRFDAVVRHFAERGIRFPLLHAGNSATAIDMPQLTYNMVRIGISMYGFYPSLYVNRAKVELEPVLSLKTAVVQVKTLPSGSGISYGTRYITQGDEMIATLPIGYADGYSRMLSGKAQALIHGKKVPVVGTICMDQCMIRLESTMNVQPGDEVVLIGQQGDACITAESLAESLGTIHYEITCMLSHRVPRVYMSQNKRIQVVNALLNQGIQEL